ncbi:GATA transcription factor 5-like isoform X1 [Juglans microcarpa x Juglans regia]|uniref:GATA transcription factor 5-like isoform X1 n=2 Tax=Juglans microcarpa x Juglans regia TaxID=2249226 RepID=UPI001B7F3512|nr:GATA transcription factor 5-like isoform X1 [Juglans microcarpa x Juglans regia]
MLYRIHHHPFFLPIPHLSLLFQTLPPLLFHSNWSFFYTESETEMECAEAALKTSCRMEMAVKTPQAVLEDLWPVNGQNGVVCDDFFVDELLDLSNEEGFVNEEPAEEDEGEEDKGFVSVSPRQDRQNSTTNIVICAKDEFGSELSVPADDLANLEWLSHFVEESFSEFCTPFPGGISTEKPMNEGPEPEPEPEPEQAKPCFKTPVPAKARSKRARTSGRVWCLGSPSLTESSASSTSSTSSSSPSSSWLVYPNAAQYEGPVEQFYSEEKQPEKKQKKKATGETASGGSGTQTPRRCSHCGVQKTPQWRTGPLGAKTLCNACGVRYKSGRLLPEYRPACSPTFSSELHSNHHRKVLEMRRKKEPTGVSESGLASPAVSSF